MVRVHYNLLAIAVVVGLLFSNPAVAKVSAEVAGLLGVVPGLGHVVQGETIEGIAWFGGVAVFFASGFGVLPFSKVSLHTGTNIWQYSIYDVYRDTGEKRKYKSTLIYDTLAAYNPLNLIDWVSPLQLGANAYVTYRGAPDTVYRGPKRFFLGVIYQTPNAMAEEALYRGYVFPVVSKVTHFKPLGALTSAVLFSFGHMLYGYSFKQVLAGTVNNVANSLLWCLQTHLNGMDIRPSIFTHMWIDVMIYHRWRNAGSPIESSSLSGAVFSPSTSLGYRLFF